MIATRCNTGCDAVGDLAILSVELNVTTTVESGSARSILYGVLGQLFRKIIVPTRSPRYRLITAMFSKFSYKYSIYQLLNFEVICWLSQSKISTRYLPLNLAFTPLWTVIT